jgi:hypothetical protein
MAEIVNAVVRYRDTGNGRDEALRRAISAQSALLNSQG